MNNKTLFGLAIAAAVAIVAAMLLNRHDAPRSDLAADQAWLAPALRDHVNDVDRIVLKGAGNNTLATLARGDKGWSLAEKGGYAVDTGKVRELLLKLADARLVEAKTSNADKYAVLGVQDVDAAGAKGTLLELGGLAQPFALVVGDSNPRGGTYVRRAGESQSWLTSASLMLDKDPVKWLQPELASIAASRIAQVDIRHGDGTRVHIAKQAEGESDFTLADVPKGREAGDAFAINSIAGVLDGLRLEDVQRVGEAPVAANALKARFETFDGMVVVVTAWMHADKHLATLEASLDSARADHAVDAAQAKAKADYDKAVADAAAAPKPQEQAANDVPLKPLALTDPAKDREQRLTKLKAEVDALNTRVTGWAFVLPAYKYASLDKPLADLLKPVEAKTGKR
ncbi:MAG: DUF4340 domain-containing protein [Dokdonella sp.]|nr:MAG: DUF4340 domain-containing protein [Dokdonella sp.]MCC6594942.1 DUF4340 domain-containing protein [Rhodanobacteraceae bacterium]